jgi:alanine racemase
MAVVKADGYGHGAVEVARAALDAGAEWVGVAHIHEALAVRRAGIRHPTLAWLHTPRSDFGAAIGQDVSLAVSGPELDLVADAARAAGRAARLHVKVDTGLGRNGAQPHSLPGLADRLAGLQKEGLVEVEGVMSHLAVADDVSRATETDAQRDTFLASIEVLEAAGVRPRVRHLANTAATLTRPDLRFDMVRVGIGLYGLNPLLSGKETVPDLRPAMTLRARLSHVKELPAGHGISYGYDYVTTTPAVVGLVPLGYADGIPRSAVGAHVAVNGRRAPLIGRVAMDQFTIELTAAVEAGEDVSVGDFVEVFGAGPVTADDWAAAAGTINYEIVSRIGSRVSRRYAG